MIRYRLIDLYSVGGVVANRAFGDKLDFVEEIRQCFKRLGIVGNNYMKCSPFKTHGKQRILTRDGLRQKLQGAAVNGNCVDVFNIRHSLRTQEWRRRTGSPKTGNPA